MAPQREFVPPPISLLPAADFRVREAIDDLALIASGLIASVDAAMLTIAVPSDRWGHDMPLVAWSQRLAASASLSRMLIDTPIFGPALDALCLAADTLFAQLEAWRWTGVDAPGLCLVTDGFSVVLSIERPPADADCGWLLELARAHGEKMTIRPPQVHGIWSLISAESETLQ